MTEETRGTNFKRSFDKCKTYVINCWYFFGSSHHDSAVINYEFETETIYLEQIITIYKKVFFFHFKIPPSKTDRTNMIKYLKKILDIST